MAPLRRCMALVSAVGIALSCCGAISADDESSKDEAPGAQSSWQRLFREHAAGYTMTVEGNEGTEVKLVSEPILQWSQPVRGGDDGAVFLWLQEGIPVAIGTLFIWPVGNGKQGVSHELHSLSQRPLSAKWRERKWTPPKDSIVWAPLAGSPTPAGTTAQRQRQMRELARQFRAESHDHHDHKWELRLLPRPIYHFEVDDKKSAAAEPEVLDGALFGFVEGTDLEAVLLLEARKTAQGHQWEFALARMSDFRLKVLHEGKTVWEVPRSGYDNPRQAYYCSTVETRISADRESSLNR